MVTSASASGSDAVPQGEGERPDLEVEVEVEDTDTEVEEVEDQEGDGYSLTSNPSKSKSSPTSQMEYTNTSNLQSQSSLSTNTSGFELKLNRNQKDNDNEYDKAKGGVVDKNQMMAKSKCKNQQHGQTYTQQDDHKNSQHFLTVDLNTIRQFECMMKKLSTKLEIECMRLENKFLLQSLNQLQEKCFYSKSKQYQKYWYWGKPELCKDRTKMKSMKKLTNNKYNSNTISITNSKTNSQKDQAQSLSASLISQGSTCTQTQSQQQQGSLNNLKSIELEDQLMELRKDVQERLKIVEYDCSHFESAVRRFERELITMTKGIQTALDQGFQGQNQNQVQHQQHQHQQKLQKNQKMQLQGEQMQTQWMWKQQLQFSLELDQNFQEIKSRFQWIKMEGEGEGLALDTDMNLCMSDDELSSQLGVKVEDIKHAYAQTQGQAHSSQAVVNLETELENDNDKGDNQVQQPPNNNIDTSVLINLNPQQSVQTIRYIRTTLQGFQNHFNYFRSMSASASSAAGAYANQERARSCLRAKKSPSLFILEGQGQGEMKGNYQQVPQIPQEADIDESEDEDEYYQMGWTWVWINANNINKSNKTFIKDSGLYDSKSESQSKQRKKQKFLPSFPPSPIKRSQSKQKSHPPMVSYSNSQSQTSIANNEANRLFIENLIAWSKRQLSNKYLNNNAATQYQVKQAEDEKDQYWDRRLSLDNKRILLGADIGCLVERRQWQSQWQNKANSACIMRNWKEIKPTAQMQKKEPVQLTLQESLLQLKQEKRLLSRSLNQFLHSNSLQKLIKSYTKDQRVDVLTVSDVQSSGFEGYISSVRKIEVDLARICAQSALMDDGLDALSLLQVQQQQGQQNLQIQSKSQYQWTNGNEFQQFQTQQQIPNNLSHQNGNFLVMNQLQVQQTDFLNNNNNWHMNINDQQRQNKPFSLSTKLQDIVQNFDSLDLDLSGLGLPLPGSGHKVCIALDDMPIWADQQWSECLGVSQDQLNANMEYIHYTYNYTDNASSINQSLTQWQKCCSSSSTSSTLKYMGNVNDSGNNNKLKLNIKLKQQTQPNPDHLQVPQLQPGFQFSGFNWEGQTCQKTTELVGKKCFEVASKMRQRKQQKKTLETIREGQEDERDHHTISQITSTEQLQKQDQDENYECCVEFVLVNKAPPPTPHQRSLGSKTQAWIGGTSSMTSANTSKSEPFSTGNYTDSTRRPSWSSSSEGQSQFSISSQTSSGSLEFDMSQPQFKDCSQNQTQVDENESGKSFSGLYLLEEVQDSLQLQAAKVNQDHGIRQTLKKQSESEAEAQYQDFDVDVKQNNNNIKPNSNIKPILNSKTYSTNTKAKHFQQRVMIFPFEFPQKFFEIAKLKQTMQGFLVVCTDYFPIDVGLGDGFGDYDEDQGNDLMDADLGVEGGKGQEKGQLEEDYAGNTNNVNEEENTVLALVKDGD